MVLSYDEFIPEQSNVSVEYEQTQNQPTTTAVKSTIKEPRTTFEIISEHRLANEVRRLQAEKKQLTKELISAQEALEVAKELADAKPRPLIRREISSGLREACPVLLNSDWHVEEKVTLEQTNNLNEYTLDIADKRLQNLTNGTLWLLDLHSNKFKFHDMIYWLGGDLLTGRIHEEGVETGQLAPIESILWLQDRIIRSIDSLLEHAPIERLVIPCNVGNHGRTTKDRRAATVAENSYEWLLYMQLAKHYADNERVQIYAPKAHLLYLEAYNYTLRFTHGDTVSYQGGIGGIYVSLNKAVAAWDASHKADITHHGHFHQHMSTENVVSNGSLIGLNGYAVTIKARFEQPRQAFYLLDSKRGKTAAHAVWVTDED